MTTFLEDLAKALLAEHGKQLRDVAVVLPSQRAGLYLRDRLSKEAESALWSPQVFTLGSWMEHLSGLRALPMEELVFEAYEAYRSVEREPMDLNEFMQWAPTTLKDISEADAYLLPLDGFYRDLRSWEELDWSFNDTPLSSGQERMVRYWAVKGRLHAALNERLLLQGAGTQGLIERRAAEHMADAPPHAAVWFAGLNALTPAQERVMAHYRDRGTAHILWDADRYYLDDPRQEAGDQLRKAIGRFGPGLLPPLDLLATRQLELDVVRAPNDAAQAWCAAQLLAAVAPEERIHTAIVLADEALLQPLLEALPTDIGPLNITIGPSVALLPVGAFLSALHQLHAGMRPGAGYFRTDVERLLRHPFVQHGANGRSVRGPLDGALSTQRAFLSQATVQEALSGLPADVRPQAKAVFDTVADVRTDMPRITTAAVAWAAVNMQDDAFATEQLYQAALVVHRTHSLLQRYHHALDARSYVTVLNKVMRSARIGLFGEPLRGAQVMGMLEARALDMERIIVVGAQEGTLPSTGADRSFIPFELRRAHGLPLRESADAVQAYNFLRMLQRAKKVTLIHPEHEGSGGPSRFILQLEHELFLKRPIEASSVRIPVPVRNKPVIKVQKDEHVLASLRALFARGLSPTALGNWLRCPLDFHFKNVLRLDEPDQVEARIASNVLGAALHSTVEAIYEPMLGHDLSSTELIAAAEGLEKKLSAELSNLLPGTSLVNGQPLLQINMATHAGERFLRHEAHMVEQGASIKPLLLEQELEAVLQPAVDALGIPVKLRGRLDRVDMRNGVVHILDLKTGRVDANALSVQQLSLDALKGDKRYAAQLLLYSWLYLTTHPEVSALQAGLLPLQHASSSSGLYLHVAGDPVITRGMMPAIAEVLAQAVLAIVDVNVPFAHDQDSRYCTFCIP